ncbi:hypothetical protein H6G17_06940 [Chroococcidiopsis sp. FACHB-1243]|uniref:hypothetical protein n=1 Tax=Chroococcidiopsis sp. [FACHB-1243] TaxID=2692781 RepID=UPI00177E891D|nr:hypothetical protein [Chroococcidiopsis sp. [FACHB-1243]]MBD2305247.1 hypothetical protein [Chroococcidiopsis sp. [FACHB-1243]]
MTDSISVNGDRAATGGRSLSLPAWLVLICIIAFTTLLAAGAAIWKNAPPVPDLVQSPQQEIILTRAEIQAGREIYFTPILLCLACMVV